MIAHLQKQINFMKIAKGKERDMRKGGRLIILIIIKSLFTE